MDENKMGWREYARYAEMSVEELARDCEVQVFRATGPGGQGVNTTDSAVRMKHIPSGITVTARESRSQFQNRSSCLRKLRAELERRGRPPRRRVKTKVPHDALASAGSTTNTSTPLKRPTVANRAGRNDLLNKLR